MQFIGPTFNELLFCTVVFCGAFICFFGFVILWQKENWRKSCSQNVQKMLVKFARNGRAIFFATDAHDVTKTSVVVLSNTQIQSIPVYRRQPKTSYLKKDY